MEFLQFNFKFIPSIYFTDNAYLFIAYKTRLVIVDRITNLIVFPMNWMYAYIYNVTRQKPAKKQEQHPLLWNLNLQNNNANRDTNTKLLNNGTHSKQFQSEKIWSTLIGNCVQQTMPRAIVALVVELWILPVIPQQ